MWSPLSGLFNGLTDLFIIGLMFHLLHDLFSNSQARILVYVNYAILFMYTILTVALIGVAFGYAAEEIQNFYNLEYDPISSLYLSMFRLYIGTSVMYVLFGVYWLVLAIVALKSVTSPVSIANSESKQANPTHSSNSSLCNSSLSFCRPSSSGSTLPSGTVR
jgi:hypothetical protein